jgi:hypothetical protein
MRMAAPDLGAIAAASREARAHHRAPEFPRLRVDRPFVPETFTQLYHTPLYRELTEAQRLRYNQLYGLRSNELFMLFEEGFTRRVIHKLTNTCVKAEPVLGECLNLMLEEESAHHQMFLDFNRRLLPELYRDGRGYFARPAKLEDFLLKQVTGRPAKWPFMLWLILLLEEFSTAFSRLLIAREQTDGLSTDYVRLHRLHMLDEVRHVALDATLIERYLERLPGWRRTLNGQVFRVLVREILAPKRSGLRVLRRLASEFRELPAILPQMESAVRSLRHDPGIYPMVMDAKALPLTHALLKEYPDFAFVQPA